MAYEPIIDRVVQIQPDGTVIRYVKGNIDSTDPKPMAGIAVRSELFERDTGKIYYFTEEGKWVVPDDNPGGEASIDLGITGASVGEYAKVKAVGPDGKPTEWESELISTEAIVAETDEWLEENISQETGYVLDRTLQTENAAAPADLVGELKTAVDDVVETVENVSIDIGDAENGSYSGSAGETIVFTSNTNSRAYTIDLSDYVGKYVMINIVSSATSSQRVSALCDTNGVISPYYGLERNLIGKTTIWWIDSIYNILKISVYKQNATSVTVTVLSPINTALHDKAARRTAYVDGSVSTSGDGTQVLPFKTIQEAVDTLCEKVRVKSGEYAAFSVKNRDIPLDIALWDMPEYTTSATYQDLPKIKIVDTSAYHGAVFENCGKVSISDVWVSGSPRYGFNATNVKELVMTRCYADTNTTSNMSLFRIINCNAKLYDCKAWGSQLDGFNIHGYGNSDLINCVAYNCGDDGVSHHDSCTGTIIGGEFYGNGKAGIASPYGGARVDIYGAYCHDNTQYGIYVDSDSGSPNCEGKISNCVCVDNTQKDIYIADAMIVGWNNIYGTKTVLETAIFTELSNT